MGKRDLAAIPEPDFCQGLGALVEWKRPGVRVVEIPDIAIHIDTTIGAVIPGMPVFRVAMAVGDRSSADNTDRPTPPPADSNRPDKIDKAYALKKTPS
jgi:hypothetical protein